MTSDQLLTLFNGYLDNLPYERQPQSLYAPIRYVLAIGGKRIRPVLMMLGYQLYRDDVENILPVASGIETYHNYTLLHDDLMDNAPMRRGHQTVHMRWDANTAILSGDTMLVLAYQRMAQCPSDKLAAVLNLFTTTALEIGEGQQYDMEFETRNDVTEAEYIEMIRLKTSVLLACALKTGAILAGAPDCDADNLYRFGEKVGLAFQLQDDFLDVYGDPAVFGKAIGGDILSNKKTYMLINALQRADNTQLKELEHWIGDAMLASDVRSTTAYRQEKIAAVTRLYNDMGIDRLALQKIDACFAEARHFLDAVNISDDRKAELVAYTNSMMRRKK